MGGLLLRACMVFQWLVWSAWQVVSSDRRKSASPFFFSSVYTSSLHCMRLLWQTPSQSTKRHFKQLKQLKQLITLQTLLTGTGCVWNNMESFSHVLTIWKPQRNRGYLRPHMYPPENYMSRSHLRRVLNLEMPKFLAVSSPSPVFDHQHPPPLLQSRLAKFPRFGHSDNTGLAKPVPRNFFF